MTSGPFYGFNRPGAKVSQGTIQNWWRHGMMGGAKAHYDGIKAFSETDQTADVKAITVPTLVMQGEDDQAAARHVHDECRRDQFRSEPTQRNRRVYGVRQVRHSVFGRSVARRFVRACCAN